MTPRGADGQTLSGDSQLVRYVNLVKLPHTVFALPFALLGVVYASFTYAVTLRHVVLVVVAFTAARFAAMGFNRIADRRLDALNPRTRDRELPAGRLSVAQASWSVAGAAGVFVAAAGLLNGACFALSPLALLWILGYSYTKRFTSWSHLWLGAALAMAPAGGYLAVAGGWSDPWWTLPAAAVAVMTWVGGFDILYALQDERFDREHGLRSAVVLLGARGSIALAKLLHLVMLIALTVFGAAAGFGLAYFVGVAVAAALLVWEHRLVLPTDLSRLDAAFFRMNGVISVVVLAFALGDRLV